MSAPNVGQSAPRVLTSFSEFCMGREILAFNRSFASAVYPTANKAFYYRFLLEKSHTYLGAIWMNGTVASGNIDVGVFSAAGALLASTGTKVQTGTTTTQKSTFSGGSLVLVSGTEYYMAVAMDNVTGTLVRVTSATAPMTRYGGARERATSFVLPADSSTWVPATAFYIPMIALYEDSWL